MLFFLKVHFGKRPRLLSNRSHIKEQDMEGHSVCKACHFSVIRAEKTWQEDRRVCCKSYHWNQSFKVFFMDPSKSSIIDQNFWASAKWTLFLFSQSGCPSNSYSSATIYTSGTTPPLFLLVLSLQPIHKLYKFRGLHYAYQHKLSLL